MQRLCRVGAVIGVVAFGASASADIVYSGTMNLRVINGDLEQEDPETVTIAGHTWQFGFVVGGPLDYSFLAATSDHSGLFTTGAGSFDARNFGEGESIGLATPWLEMYPIGGGTANDNLVMHDYAANTGSSGDFAANETGYVGFAFGEVGDRTYGWMKFRLTETTERRIISLLGWAYEDNGGAILAGQTSYPGVPGPAAAAGLIGLAGIRAGRRRG